jgi:ribulose bisphosphate carboxylase small subunit
MKETVMKSNVQQLGRGLMLTGALTLGVFVAGVARSLSPLQNETSTMGGGSITSNRPPKNSTQSAQSKTIRPGSAFTQEQINYFMEIAMGAEYNQESTPKVHKWSGDVNIQVFGKPTQADLATLQSVMREINALASGAIRLQLVDRNPNLTIHFAPESQFNRLEPAYVPVNYGFFVTRWDNKGIINYANILVASTGITQKERSHLIREELTQSLGLMRDSYRYSDSMFYQAWTDLTRFSDLDKSLIQMLYMPALKPGMTEAEALNVLNSSQARSR